MPVIRLKKTISIYDSQNIIFAKFVFKKSKRHPMAIKFYDHEGNESGAIDLNKRDYFDLLIQLNARATENEIS